MWCMHTHAHTYMYTCTCTCTCTCCTCRTCLYAFPSARLNTLSASHACVRTRRVEWFCHVSSVRIHLSSCLPVGAKRERSGTPSQPADDLRAESERSSRQGPHPLLLVVMRLWQALLIPASLSPSALRMPTNCTPIYASLRPLIGGPAFLPLHVEIIHEGSIYDFLPQSPTAIETTAVLLRGGSVDGTVRCRPSTRVRGRLLGHTFKTPDEMQSFAEQQPLDLSLQSNSCWTFAASLARYALDEID